MKLKVKTEFVDKYTNEIYKVGQVLEVTDSRGNEILSSKLNLVEVVKVKKSKEVNKE